MKKFILIVLTILIILSMNVICFAEINSWVNRFRVFLCPPSFIFDLFFIKVSKSSGLIRHLPLIQKHYLYFFLIFLSLGTPFVLLYKTHEIKTGETLSHLIALLQI